MGTGLKSLIITIVGLLFVAGCRRNETNTGGKAYIAGLQLDSTRLLLSTVADSLEVPRDIEWGPGGYLWYCEQKGTVGRISLNNGKKEILWRIPDVYHRKSTGVLSMALHPDFEKEPYIYVHYTYAEKDSNFLDRIESRVIRMRMENDKPGSTQTVLNAIPGNTFHNGSSMMFGPDGMLWLSTGDAGETAKTQLSGTLYGKVLRMNPDGSVPSGNPYPGSLVWSRGHRNIQGLCSGNGLVYASEHGPNNDDELNLIEKGKNYGWPDVHGFCDLKNEMLYCADSVIREPLKSWTPTVAVAGLEYYESAAIPEWKNSLLLANLKGRALRVLRLSGNGSAIESEHLFLQKVLGRIRAVATGPKGEIYLATSNLDWHPGHQPWMYDSLPTANGDRIVLLQPLPESEKAGWAHLGEMPILREEPEAITLESENFAFSASEEELSAGQKLYLTHCASCHRPDGKGNPGFIPPLVNSEWVSGNAGRLIDVTLAGLNSPIEVNNIRYEGEMPGYKHLDDDAIRDILNFVRTEFGGVSGNIIAADVMHQRKGLK